MKRCPKCGEKLTGKKPWLVTRYIRKEYYVEAESRQEAVSIAADENLPHKTVLARVSCVSAIWKGKHHLPTNKDANALT